jgi:uncharacterized protein (TIGR02996 family)
MRAQEVRQVIRSVFAAGCRAHGFRRIPGHDLGWYHPGEEHFFVIKFRTGLLWSEHWGGGIHCSVSVRDQIQRPLGAFQPVVWRPVVSLVSDADRDMMRDWYNEAAARTTIPEETDDPARKSERRYAETLKIPLAGPLSAKHDFLMRFHTADDLRRWAKFVLERLPDWLRVLTAAWSASPHRANLRAMELHQPFLDAIRAEPESDAPRLAYADWLGQREDPWAEVIRIQCRYAECDLSCELPWETRVRLEELLQTHRHRWDRGADDLGVKVWFRRGMVEAVYCSAAKFLEVGKRLWEAFPLIHSVEIHGIRGRGAKLAARRELSAARSLRLNDLADDDGERIFRSPHLTRVEKLRVALPRPIDLAWLLDMPVARGLRVLDLSGSKLTADVLGLFGQTDATSRLETLILNTTGMDDEMARRLSEVTTFRNLKRLSVAENRRLGTAGITAILQAEFAPRLEALQFADDWFDASQIKRLIESTTRR